MVLKLARFTFFFACIIVGMMAESTAAQTYPGLGVAQSYPGDWNPPLCEDSQGATITCPASTPSGCDRQYPPHASFPAFNRPFGFEKLNCPGRLFTSGAPTHPASTDTHAVAPDCIRNPAACEAPPPCKTVRSADGSAAQSGQPLTVQGRCEPDTTARGLNSATTDLNPPVPPNFCASHPGSCIPPKGRRADFCIAHPDVCHMANAVVVHPENPAANNTTLSAH
jgi:hypothetical protein